MPNLIGEIFFAVTDHYDVIQFKVVDQVDRGEGCIQLRTELVGEYTSDMEYQHLTYYANTFARSLLKHTICVFRTYSEASNLAIQLMEQKVTEIDQERQNMLNLIEKMKASQHGPKTN
jgi:hypothetical protein